jgi:hypothetical protein
VKKKMKDEKGKRQPNVASPHLHPPVHPIRTCFPKSVTRSFPAHTEIFRGTGRTSSGRRPTGTPRGGGRSPPIFIWHLLAARARAHAFFSFTPLDITIISVVAISAFFFLLLVVPGDSGPLARSLRGDLPPVVGTTSTSRSRRSGTQ